MTSRSSSPCVCRGAHDRALRQHVHFHLALADVVAQVRVETERHSRRGRSAPGNTRRRPASSRANTRSRIARITGGGLCCSTITEKKRSNAGSASSVSIDASRWNSTLSAPCCIEMRARQREMARGNVGGDDVCAPSREPGGDAADAATELEAGRIVARADAGARQRRIEPLYAVLAARVERIDVSSMRAALNFSSVITEKCGSVSPKRVQFCAMWSSRRATSAGSFDLVDLHRRFAAVKRQARAGARCARDIRPTS